LQWLNHTLAFKLFAAIEAVNFQKAPLGVVIIGPSDHETAFEAGRCLQRVWVKLRELGLSANTYSVLGSSGEHEQCLTQSLVPQEWIRGRFGMTMPCIACCLLESQ
jgi:hypothetical protein